MKKTYIAPSVDVVAVEATQILAASGGTIEFGGSTGVPTEAETKGEAWDIWSNDED